MPNVHTHIYTYIYEIYEYLCVRARVLSITLSQHYQETNDVAGQMRDIEVDLPVYC